MSQIGTFQRIMIEAIQDPLVAGSVQAEIAEALAADLRYGIWFYDQKGRGKAEVLDELLDEYETVTDACESAWEAYKRSHETEQLKGLLRCLGDLRGVLVRQVATI